uniref:Uncharacterized protein n=1 Tax=Rhinolophus ferrumequinum TaxID=59479 RepID=A0A671DM38_RHIFE
NIYLEDKRPRCPAPTHSFQRKLIPFPTLPTSPTQPVIFWAPLIWRLLGPYPAINLGADFNGHSVRGRERGRMQLSPGGP